LQGMGHERNCVAAVRAEHGVAQRSVRRLRSPCNWPTAALANVPIRRCGGPASGSTRRELLYGGNPTTNATALKISRNHAGAFPNHLRPINRCGWNDLVNGYRTPWIIAKSTQKLWAHRATKLWSILITLAGNCLKIGKRMNNRTKIVQCKSAPNANNTQSWFGLRAEHRLRLLFPVFLSLTVWE